MGYLKGHSVIATVGTLAEGAALASTNSTLTVTANTEDVTTKEDVSDGVLYPNEEMQYKSAVLQVEGYQKDSEDVLGTMDVGDEVACTFVSGLREYSFNGIIKEINLTGELKSTAGYTMTINSVGEITYSAVTSGSGTSTP